MNNTSIIDKKK